MQYLENISAQILLTCSAYDERLQRSPAANTGSTILSLKMPESDDFNI